MPLTDRMLLCGFCIHDSWWEISEEEFKRLESGSRYCTVYPDGVPSSVEAYSECPKLKKKDDVDIDLDGASKT